ETLYRLSKVHYDVEQTSQDTLKNIISEVASILGHTPTICQKCYIYPEIITKWKEKQINAWMERHYRLAEDKDILLLHWLEEHIKE
ncbi:MAG: hypothetical protein HYX60_12110, partial [Legionella longbeachae]|nr:hypothetical protein [Legionella longbeachae]